MACGTKEAEVLDHHRPLHEGHALLHNSVPLCWKCNARKRRRSPESFYDVRRLSEIEAGLRELEARYLRQSAGNDLQSGAGAA